MSSTVSDAEPLIHLAQINKIHLLKKIFNLVPITRRVERGVIDKGIELGYNDAMIVRKAIDEDWIIIEEITSTAAEAAKRLAEGENISRSDAETLMLAKGNEAESVLIDEKVLSDLAKMYGFKVWNTWTILLEALSRGFIEISDIESAIRELGERRHKLKLEQAAEILEAAKLIASTKRREKTKAKRKPLFLSDGGVHVLRVLLF